jgi:hypothetical protein
VARAVKEVRDVMLSNTIPADRKVRELDDREVSWAVMAAIGSWTAAQRDAIANGAGEVERLLGPLGEATGLDWNTPIAAWPKEMVVRLLTRVLALAVELKVPVPPFFSSGRDPLAEIIAYSEINEIPYDKHNPLAGETMADVASGGVACRLALDVANPLRESFYEKYPGVGFGNRPVDESGAFFGIPQCMICNWEMECKNLTAARRTAAGVS